MADQVSMDVCPVCLKEFGNLKIGKLPCSHIFCFPCIEEWSKNMNTCPVDRSKFSCIKVYLQINGKCTGEVTVDDKKIAELFIDNDNVVCELCHSEANENLLLLCDGCDRGFHTYCLTPPLSDVPDGLWYCTRCLPIVTSVEYLSDSDNNCSHGDSSDDDIVVSNSSLQRRSGRISSDDSSIENDDSNFSVELVSSLPSSQISSHDDVSSFITMTTDSDNSAASQCSNAVIDSNHDGDNSSPHRETIASRTRIAYSNHLALRGDCLVTNSNHDNCTNQLIPEQSSHGDNIKRRLRNYSSVKNGHRVWMRRNSTGSLPRCILSVSDSEQSDIGYLPPCGSYPSSSHTHIAMHRVKSIKRTPQTCPSVTTGKPRGIKRHHRSKNKRGKKKRRKLKRPSLQHLIVTPTAAVKRARTAATSPRARVDTVSDTPQSAIRRLAKARCQTASLEEARKISRIQPNTSQPTQNDIIAHQVRSKQQEQQTLWWDHKAIACHKSNAKVVCSPLKNAMKRHPVISSASLKYLDKSHGKQKGKETPQFVTSSDVISNIFAGMDTLYNKDATVLRSGKIATPPKHKK